MTEGLQSDHPIERPEDDKLDRAGIAQSFAEQVLELDASQGVVVGVLGAWGSGKTSFVNLVRREIDSAGIPILDFNPWMFSGADQLVVSFLAELAAQLRIRSDFKAVAQDLGDYGEALSTLVWIPMAGPWLERGKVALRVFSKIFKSTKSVEDQRTRVEDALRKFKNPIIVVMDDIDRLPSKEIQDVFQLVRLTASFPNVIYVVAFDRFRVETALSESNLPGRDYLEKILLLAVDLPEIPLATLQDELTDTINLALRGLDNPGPFDADRWPDVFVEIIQPLVGDIRAVKRYAMAVRGSVRTLDGRIELVDVLGIEAVRLFLPDVYHQLHKASSALTIPAPEGFGSSEKSGLREAIDGLIEAAEIHADVVRAMIERLFPMAMRHIGGPQYGRDFRVRWLREGRVAHEDNLGFYLERTAGAHLTALMRAEEAFGLMTDAGTFDAFMRGLDPKELEQSIKALEYFEDDFSEEHVEPSVVVLLNLMPEIPERPRGMFEVPAEFTVQRVVYRLLRTIGDQQCLEQIVDRIEPQLATLAAKWRVIKIVGHREGSGHRLVSEVKAMELEENWRSEVRATPLEQLLNEPDLLRTLLLTKSDAKEGEPEFTLPDSPELTLKVLREAVGETKSQEAGSRAVLRSKEIAWNELVEVFDGEEELGRRIEVLLVEPVENEEELFALVEKYRGGWRPED